jgi:hypothetical protein
MKASSLRVEFVVAGSATLLAAYGLWHAFARFIRHHAPPLHKWLTFDPIHKSSGAILFVALFLAAAFVVGALVVQLTFEFPGRLLRDAAYCWLFDEREKLRKPSDPQDPPQERLGVGSLLKAAQNPEPKNRKRLPEAFRLGWWKVGQLDQSPARLALADIGWMRLTPDVAREVEYRRSNRQIFLGIAPALVLGGLAAFFGSLSRPHASLGWRIAEAVVAAAVTYVAAGLAFIGALYQEKVIASFLLDAALLRRDSGDQPTLDHG